MTIEISEQQLDTGMVHHETTSPEVEDVMTSSEVIEFMGELACDRSESDDAYESSSVKLQRSLGSKRGVLMEMYMNYHGIKDRSLDEVSLEFFSMAFEETIVKESIPFYSVLSDDIKDLDEGQQRIYYGVLRRMVSENDAFLGFDDRLLETVRSETEDLDQESEEYKIKSKALDFLDRCINGLECQITNPSTGEVVTKKVTYAVASFSNGLIDYVESVVGKKEESGNFEDFVGNVQAELLKLNTQLTELSKLGESLDPIMGFGSRVKIYIEENYGLKPTKKEQKSELDDEILSNLLRLQMKHRGQDIDESQVGQRLVDIREQDKKYSIYSGLELEIASELDSEDVADIISKIDKIYTDNKSRRDALQVLMALGIPVDEDGLGEVCLPKSKGVYAQIAAWEILEEIGVLPKDKVTVHISFSGLENPEEYADDLLLISLAFSATDIFGEVPEAEIQDDMTIGFGQHSQKPLFKTKEARFHNLSPKGLPILIEGERIEFRGLGLAGPLNLDQAKRGFPLLADIFQDLVNYSRGEESNWEQRKADILRLLSRSAYDGVPPRYLDYKLGEDPNFDVMSCINQVVPLERYLKALTAYPKLQIKKMKSIKPKERKSFDDEMIEIAKSDPTFIDNIFDYVGEVPEDREELLEEIHKYYGENHTFRDSPESAMYFVKNWEKMRGRIIVAASRDEQYKSQMQELLAA